MNKEKNGVTNILTPEQQQQRLQIVDLELKARYWEAQWKVRFYTLESEKLQTEYDEYLTDQKEKQEKALEEFRKAIEDMNTKAEEGKIKVEENELVS